MIGYEEEETKTDGRVCKTTYKTELVEIVFFSGKKNASFS